MSAALIIRPAQFLEVRPLLRGVTLGSEHQRLLNIWSPREYFRAMARDGVTKGAALDNARDCRRCRRVHSRRLREIAGEEYDRLYARQKGGL